MYYYTMLQCFRIRQPWRQTSRGHVQGGLAINKYFLLLCNFFVCPTTYFEGGRKMIPLILQNNTTPTKELANPIMPQKSN